MFESAILIFFQKRIFFSFFPIKTIWSLLVSKDGSKGLVQALEQALLIKPNVTTLFDPCQTFWMGVCVPLWFQNTFQNFQSVADSISRKLSHEIPKRWKWLSQFKKALTPLYNLQFTLVRVRVWTVVYYHTVGSGQSNDKIYWNLYKVYESENVCTRVGGVHPYWDLFSLFPFSKLIRHYFMGIQIFKQKL